MTIHTLIFGQPAASVSHSAAAKSTSRIARSTGSMLSEPPHAGELLGPRRSWSRLRRLGHADSGTLRFAPILLLSGSARSGKRTLSNLVPRERRSSLYHH